VELTLKRLFFIGSLVFLFSFLGLFAQEQPSTGDLLSQAQNLLNQSDQVNNQRDKNLENALQQITKQEISINSLGISLQYYKSMTKIVLPIAITEALVIVGSILTKGFTHLPAF
jgi:hypothetical protein